MELAEIERRLRTLMGHFRSELPADQLEVMKSLAEAGEPGVALENYCSQLFEYDILVPAAVVGELEKLGRAMGIDEKYWVRLRK